MSALSVVLEETEESFALSRSREPATSVAPSAAPISAAPRSDGAAPRDGVAHTLEHAAPLDRAIDHTLDGEVRPPPSHEGAVPTLAQVGEG